MWRHIDVIGRNEYLISTLSESTFLRYIHCNFCLNLHITHGYMKKNASGCFFSEQSVELNLNFISEPQQIQYDISYNHFYTVLYKRWMVLGASVLLSWIRTASGFSMTIEWILACVVLAHNNDRNIIFICCNKCIYWWHNCAAWFCVTGLRGTPAITKYVLSTLTTGNVTYPWVTVHSAPEVNWATSCLRWALSDALSFPVSMNSQLSFNTDISCHLLPLLLLLPPFSVHHCDWFSFHVDGRQSRGQWNAFICVPLCF